MRRTDPDRSPHPAAKPLRPSHGLAPLGPEASREFVVSLTTEYSVRFDLPGDRLAPHQHLQ